jgi:hypothetical protein
MLDPDPEPYCLFRLMIKLFCVPENNRIYISLGGEQRERDGERDEGTEKRRQGPEGTEEQREQLASRFRSSPPRLLPGKNSFILVDFTKNISVIG